MSIKVAHLSSDIANADPIHQAQNGALELSETAGNRPGTALASVFPSTHVSTMVKTVFDRPMFSDQGEETSGRSLLHREAAQAVDDFMAKLVRVEQEGGAFEPKDLLHSLPLLAEPVIEVRATGDLPMLEPSMGFVPRFCLLPSSPIRRAILKQVSTSFMQGGLIVFGDQDILAVQPMDTCAHLLVRMHRIQAKNAPFDH